MNRTRKWIFVAQEAARLAALGLSQAEIASKLGVDRSSIFRWMKSGKLKRNEPPNIDPTIPKQREQKERNAADWSKSVREAYDLDSTDEQLVAIGESALALALNQSASAATRLQAAGRFQAIVKQLRLVARAEASAPVEQPKRKTNPVVQRSRTDPRALLSVVK